MDKFLNVLYMHKTYSLQNGKTTLLFIIWKFLLAVVYCKNYRVLGMNTVK